MLIFMKAYLNASEVAKLLRVDRATVSRWLKRGVIKGAIRPDNTRQWRTLSVCDPCVGSGRMLLHASNLSLNLWGQDIDSLAIAMCKINGALYAPWLSFPFSPAILGGNVHGSSGPEAERRAMLPFKC